MRVLFRVLLSHSQVGSGNSELEAEVIELVRKQLAQPGRRGFVWTFGRRKRARMSRSQTLLDLPREGRGYF